MNFFNIFGDRFRQALYDKFAGTYVIKKNAEPAGRAGVKYDRYQLAFFTFIFAEMQLEEEGE